MATVRDPKESIPFNRPVDGQLIKAKLKYWGWTILVKVPFAVMYANTIAEGFRILADGFGKKVHSIPVFGFLKKYELFYHLDVAPFFAVMLIVAVFGISARLIKFWLALKPGYCVTQHDRFVILLSLAVLNLDAYLFFRGLTSMSWGGTFSINAALATAAYMSVVAYVSYVSVELHSKIKELED